MSELLFLSSWLQMVLKSYTSPFLYLYKGICTTDIISDKANQGELLHLLFFFTLMSKGEICFLSLICLIEEKGITVLHVYALLRCSERGNATILQEYFSHE